MTWAEIKNLQSISLNEIPDISINILREEVIKKYSTGHRVIQFFGCTDDDCITLYAVMADDQKSLLYVSSARIEKKGTYQCLSNEIPALHLFERELFEELGIEPSGHPWLKPVRKGIAGINNSEIPYKFFKMSGEEVHEVGVGPIHAGVIEPGHFRFSCHGEEIYYLEIQLGFQHRGIENLFTQAGNNQLYLLKLAESIAGDTVIGHTGTFARAMESLSGINISRRAMLIRTIALELERVGIHLGDLSALSNDVAYLTGKEVFAALRTKVINTTMAICGSRFGKSLIATGGVNYNISSGLASEISFIINRLETEVEIAAEVLFSSSSTLARFEKTGVITKETARKIGMVGPSARASGISVDVRSDLPFGGYEFFPVHKITLDSGDVFARAYIRYVEIMQSLRIIKEQLSGLFEGELMVPPMPLKENSLVVSMAEGWRGEIAHTAITGRNGILKRYKIKDPSFNNWFALALAVRNNGISDFPLSNKSFNLSYCGFDL